MKIIIKKIKTPNPKTLFRCLSPWGESTRRGREVRDRTVQRCRVSAFETKPQRKEETQRKRNKPQQA
jgi:hypothetical protein